MKTKGKNLIVFLILACTSAGIWGQTMSSRKTVSWKMLLNEAGNNDKDAQYIVGKTYLEGSDLFFSIAPGKLDTVIHVNKEQAVYWLRKAAEQGVAKAETELGTCYSLGEGVEASNEQALYWFRKAADQGHSLAQSNLGVYYKEGYGIEKNGDIALYWFEKAIKNKDREVDNHLAAIKEFIKELKKAGYSSDRAQIE